MTNVVDGHSRLLQFCQVLDLGGSGPACCLGPFSPAHTGGIQSENSASAPACTATHHVNYSLRWRLTDNRRRRGQLRLRQSSDHHLSENGTAYPLIYKQNGNLRAVQILLGHTKIESTVRCLGVDIEDALALADGTDIRACRCRCAVGAGNVPNGWKTSITI